MTERQYDETTNKLRDSVFKLFQDAGYELPELLDWMEAHEELTRENERLKLANKKLRDTITRQESGGMSSRLKEALRE